MTQVKFKITFVKLTLSMRPTDTHIHIYSDNFATIKLLASLFRNANANNGSTSIKKYYK